MSRRADRRRIAHQVASRLLDYPDRELVETLPLLASATDSLPKPVRTPLHRFIDHVRRTSLQELEIAYVDTFDLQRRCSLYLTYYTCGDTRNRGVALLRFKQAYAAAGLDLGDRELPDHLSVLLEFSASAGSGDGKRVDTLFAENRAGLRALTRTLEQRRSPYADVLTAVNATLPRSSGSG